jgi:NADPH:quinone reductase
VRAAVVEELGGDPELREWREPSGDVVVDVVAVPLNPLDFAVAAGRFYGGHPPLPYVPGCEAVGRVQGTGELVWTFGGGLGLTRDGALAERATTTPDRLAPVPDGADPAIAAALGIAGMAGWMPVASRAPVRAGETVLVLGAGGTVGLVAVQAARLLGAGRVVAAGRNPGRLARALDLGADAVAALNADELREAAGGDGPSLIVDPLWGDAVVPALEAAAPRARIVHLGQSAGPEATLSSALVRGKELEILGHSNFAVPIEVLRSEYARLVGHAIAGEIQVEVERASLDQAPDAWRRQRDGEVRKTVVTIEAR